jgi:hypothetical protein
MKKIVYDISDMTRVEWMGITILEPVTVLTNLLITSVCIYAFIKLGKLQEQNQVRKLLRYFFLFMAFATAIGGILGHGFLYVTGLYGKLPGWYSSMLAVAFIERAAIVHSRPIMKASLGRFFSILNYIEVTLFIILTFITFNFRFVEAHATYGLFVVVFCFELYTYIKKKDRGSWLIFVGTSLAAIAALTHMFKLSLHEWFTYNDVSHVFMAIAIYYYYQGAVNLKMYAPAADNLQTGNVALHQDRLPL